LRATGARVVIPTMPCVGAVPGAGPGVGSALDVRRVEAANAVIRRVAHRHPGAIAVPDVFALLCPTGRYHKDVRLADGSHIKRVRADGEHYTKDGATFVANFLRP
jgi:hypothetical protein